MSPYGRFLFKWARHVHMYLTMFVLVLLVFFAVTGYMLNHEDWFSPTEPYETKLTGTVPRQMLAEPDKLAIVELLRRDYGAVGELNSFDVEEGELRIAFKRASVSLEAVVDRETGSLNATRQTRGTIGIMLDLHRGKSTGHAWSLVIDGLCIAVLIVAVTGFILWTSLRGRGHYGFLVALLGTLLGLVVVFFFLP